MNLPHGFELYAILAVAILLFGGKRLPGAARSLGQSMRIFKAETKGLRDEFGDTAPSSPAQAIPPAPPVVTDPGAYTGPPPAQQQAAPPAPAPQAASQPTPAQQASPVDPAER